MLVTRVSASSHEDDQSEHEDEQNDELLRQEMMGESDADADI